jgi:hypothetical protein
LNNFCFAFLLKFKHQFSRGTANEISSPVF